MVGEEKNGLDLSKIEFVSSMSGFLSTMSGYVSSMRELIDLTCLYVVSRFIKKTTTFMVVAHNVFNQKKRG